MTRFGSAVSAVPFIVVHVLAVVLAIQIGATPTLVALCLAAYCVRMFFLTAGYHRYFSHRSYKTSRPFQFVLAFASCTCAQKGPLWWASHHRNHHRYSDTPRDVHSAVRDGFWWSHVGWILSPKYKVAALETIMDFAVYRELRWLDRFHLVPPLLGAGVLWLLGGLPWVVWGGLLSTVILWHGTFTINSLAHLIGGRRYSTKDSSRNNFVLALITCGEGWHNNHHHYQSSAAQGFFWWEIDVTYYLLKVLELFRVVWDVRKPPAAVLDLTAADAPTETTAA